jgi:hypothetical protein
MTNTRLERRVLERLLFGIRFGRARPLTTEPCDCPNESRRGRLALARPSLQRTPRLVEFPPAASSSAVIRSDSRKGGGAIATTGDADELASHSSMTCRF